MSALRMQLIDKLEGIIRESVKPMERIEGIRDPARRRAGRRRRRRQRRGQGNGGNFADSVVNSALRFRAQAPLIDQLLREIGVQGGDIGLVGGAAAPRRRCRRARRRASSRMIKVYVSSVIDAPADTVWARVRDFNGLPHWTPFVAEVAHRGGPAGRPHRLRAPLPHCGTAA